MTCDEISRMGVDELRRDLRTARRQLATALDLVRTELTDLERTHPDVKAAAESYDAMVQTLPVIPKGRMTLITSEPDEPP